MTFVRINTAKITITTPEILLIILSEKFFTFDLIHPTPKLNINHQRAEPRKTPTTKEVAEMMLLFVNPKPTPANNAVKEMMVIGFVTVKNTVEI